MPDTLPIDEVLKPFEGKRLKLYVAGMGAMDGFLEADLGHGFSTFRQPPMEVPHPMTGQGVQMPEAKINIDRRQIVGFELSEETAVSRLSSLM